MVKKTLILFLILISGCTVQRPCPAIIISDNYMIRQQQLYDEAQREAEEAEIRKRNWGKLCLLTDIKN
jgi:hypothetical protein